MSLRKFNFEITPEIQAILDCQPVDMPRGRLLHPYISPDSQFDDNGMVIYNVSMSLPKIDDKKGILAWLGSSNEAADIVLQDYTEYQSGNMPQPYGSVLRVPTKTRSPERTLLTNLANVFILGIAIEWSSDEASDLISYVNAAYEIGLSPEFLMLAGLPLNEDISEADRQWRCRLSPRDYVEEQVRELSCILTALWKQRTQFRRLEDEKMMDQKTKTSTPMKP